MRQSEAANFAETRCYLVVTGVEGGGCWPGLLAVSHCHMKSYCVSLGVSNDRGKARRTDGKDNNTLVHG